MHIDYCLDQLTPRAKLNKFHDGNRSILYLRIDNKYFLEYHPWEQFGDISIEQMISLIKSQSSLPPFLEFLLELEKKKTYITHGVFFNHGLMKPNDAFLNASVVKLKTPENLQSLNSYLEKMTKVRLDFNNYDDPIALLDWAGKLPNKLIKKIDYIEDPSLSYEVNKKLNELGLSLAADRNIFDPSIYTYKIYKPNVDGKIQLNKSIFSSYMGGDLGRYHTYLCLMKYGDLSLCHGVDTPDIYTNQLQLFEAIGMNRYPNISNIQKMYDELERKEWIRI